ncbi:MAG: DUF4249 family protein [Bacteroidales bacterium]|nr:DUF4249 family protein [Bacteroidales bacterium]
MKHSLWFLMAVMLFAACKADFNPNADWKEVPLVYCVLDQDDTVSYVRVQKCYLGDDNLKSYASIRDSSNYAEGELRVEILVWPDEASMVREGALPIRTLAFDYQMLHDKASGVFSSPDQPVYLHRNVVGDFDTSAYYQLVVTKVATGAILARSTTRLIGNPQHESWIETPHPSIYGRSFHFRRYSECPITWYAFSRGRRYQVQCQYYYRCRYVDPDSVRSIVMTLPYKVSTLTESQLTTALSSSTFFAEMEHALSADTSTKMFVDSARISLAICNEPLHAYLNSIDMIRSQMGQEQQLYSNIEGGIGVFGARRTHLSVCVPADASDVPPLGLHYLIRELNLGFQQPEKL